MVNTILLSKNGCYVDNNGKLPKRPSFDKELLSAFCQDQTVSHNGYLGLPPSMRKKVKVPSDLMTRKCEITMAVTIPEISELSGVLLVIRSTEDIQDGKQFRLDKFKCLVKNGELEIWVKK